MTKVYACDKCEKEFQNISMLKQHAKDHQKQIKTKGKTKNWTNIVQKYHQKQPKAKEKIKKLNNFVKNFQKKDLADAAERIVSVFKEEEQESTVGQERVQKKDLEDVAERFVTIFKEEKKESNIDICVEPNAIMPLPTNVFDNKELEQRYEARVSKWDDMMEKFKKYDEEYDDQYEVEDLEIWAKDVDYSTDEESDVEGKYNIGTK